MTYTYFDKDLDENPFRPGRPEDFISMTTGNEYKEFTMDDPVIKEIIQFISEILPDKDVREYILTLLSSFSQNFLSWKRTEQALIIWFLKGSLRSESDMDNAVWALLI